MICIQKIYGFHGLNHQIIEESLDVTPVTDERTDGRKVENRAVFCWTRNRKKCVDTLCQMVKNMHCISCSNFYRCSHRLFFQSMRKFPPTDVRFTQNRVFHLDRNLFLLSGRRPLETLGLCGKRLECAGKGASQVWCSLTVPVDWDICAGYNVTIT